ncbi:AraC family transcriptional regulator [Paenibacillus planticolens]|uniref:AraC family transcriptional regulator n=1 Tax=Paenibacillus planticolens TaxID=2654976 RepID=A0ABX1ZN78_9BACL|nr:AraC family transcriptional regulator [Paenibacillus planticolens]NOV00337.1 AraC family transcriptional regulator [Paenibacillus planticolens]
MKNTMGIETNKSLNFEKVMSLRKKKKISEVQYRLSELINYITENGANKCGPLISATFGAEIINGEQVIDMEFLVAIDKEIRSTKDYSFKPLFLLVNAVYIRYIGDPRLIENAYNNLNSFISQNNFQPITAVYNINLTEEEKLDEGKEHIMDIYIGMNPNLP